jgi:uncharacterized protein
MKAEARNFYSDGYVLDGRIYWPDDYSPDGRYPLVIACSGFTGLHQIHPARFARYLTARGYLCFSFDYRGFGDSEGEKMRVILEEQVRDIRSAVATAIALPSVERGNVVLLGWAMGAGLVLDAARELPGVSGLCCLNGLYDGADFQRWHRGEEGLAQLRSDIEDEGRRRAHTGKLRWVDPFTIYPLDPVTESYVTGTLHTFDAYDASACSFELAESLLRWSVLPQAPQMNLPLFLAHGEDNKLHPPHQASALADAYGGPVQVEWLAKAGHTEWMEDDHPTFRDLCDRLHSWLEARGARSGDCAPQRAAGGGTPQS